MLQQSRITSSCIQRYDNLNQLAMWGVVYQESNGAGFTLEFVGDMHDSVAGAVMPWTGTGNFNAQRANGVLFSETGSAGAGRGIN